MTGSRDDDDDDDGGGDDVGRSESQSHREPRIWLAALFRYGPSRVRANPYVAL